MARYGRILQFARYYSDFYGDTLHEAFPERLTPTELFYWRYEGPGNLYHMFENPDYNVGATIPVYRFWSPSLGDHWITPQSFVGGDYRYEGVVGYVYNAPGPYRRAMYSFVRYFTAGNGVPGANHYESWDSTPVPGYTSLGLAWYSPILVYGCGDPAASNYNVYVNQPNTGCNYFIFGCTDPAASNYNRNANRDDGSCTYPIPSVDINASPTAIIRGNSSQLTWSISNATSAFISNVGSVSTGSNGPITISPFSTTTYTLSASGRGGSATDSVTVYVYIPPVVTLTLDATTINRGQSTTLRWSTTGDGSTMNISPGIGSTNLTSLSTVSPTQTTTYTAYVSGPGGSDTDQITLTVLQPPSVSISGPFRVNYGNTVSISYSGTNVTSAFYLFIEYYSLDDNITIKNYQLPTGNSSSGTYVDNISYNNRGPNKIKYTLYGVGSGNLTDFKTIEVDVDIDETPAVIDIPQSEDKVRDEEPVITPDAEITTEQILIDDIDIPVEIKANAPVQIEIDNNGVWRNVREI